MEYNADDIRKVLNKINSEIDKYTRNLSQYELAILKKYLIHKEEYWNFKTTLVPVGFGLNRDERSFDFDPDRTDFEFSLDKIKILFQLVLKSQHINEHDAATIISFMEKMIYGWNSDRYIFNNECLQRSQNNCKKLDKLQSPLAENTFLNFQEIFFNSGECSDITMFIFSYCIAASFTSRLKQDNIHIPLFLQIACERGSEIYELIHEIVEMCDVNNGLVECCVVSRYDRHYCGYRCAPWHPTNSFEKDLGKIIERRDIPIIVDGTTNDKQTFYDDWLRNIAAIYNARKNIEEKNQFNALPIFIVPKIKLHFRSVMNMDLTEVTVSKEYLARLKKNKSMFASWVFKLISDYEEHLLLNNKAAKKFPFSNTISERTRLLLSRYDGISPKEGNNIGFLNFFFEGFINVFESILPEKLAFGNNKTFNTHELLRGFKQAAEKKLVETQKQHSPVAEISIIDDTNEQDQQKLKKKQMEADKLAKDMIKYYQSFNVLITVIEIVIREDRYVFSVRPLPGTRKQAIFKVASEVQLFLEKAWFIPVEDAENQVIKIVVSDTVLDDNSLLKILESPLFADPKFEIPYAMGYDIMGDIFVNDFKDFYHLLVGGTSGFGKSSALFSLLMSIVYKQYTQKLDNVNIIIIDIGQSGFDLFNKVPYMSCPVISDLETAFKVIKLLCDELEDRRELREKNIKEFNKLPHIVCVIDEFPSFIQKMIDAGFPEMVETISDILFRSRKFHINIVLAAIDPIKDQMQCNITPISARIAFKCAQPHNSRVILGGESDAAQLVGVGNMYFKSGHHLGLKFMRGAFMPTTIEEAKKLKIKPSIEEVIDNMDFSDYRESRYKFKLLEEFLNKIRIEYEGEDEPRTALTKSDPFEEERNKSLAEIIMEALKTRHLATSAIINKCHICDSKALSIRGQWEEWNFIKRKPGNTGYSIISNRFEEIPDGILEILNKYFSDDEIKNAIDKKSSETAVQTEA